MVQKQQLGKAQKAQHAADISVSRLSSTIQLKECRVNWIKG